MRVRMLGSLDLLRVVCLLDCLELLLGCFKVMDERKFCGYGVLEFFPCWAWDESTFFGVNGRNF